MPMKRLEHLRGISDEECSRLRAAGVMNSNQLLHATTLVLSRERLSRRSGVSPQRLLALGQQASLLEISGMSRHLAVVLRLGISTIEDLKTAEPAELHAKLLDAEGYGAPALSEVEYWISQARCLDVVELAEETRADRLRHWVPR